MFRTRGAARFVAAVGAVALVVPMTGAYADNLVADGDIATTKADGALAFGSVCAGSTVLKDVAVVITRNGQGNNDGTVFKNGSTVTLSSPGLTFPNGNTIAVPTGWEGMGNNTETAAVTAKASFTAGATTGNVNGSIVVTASGTNVNNATYSKSATLTSSATVVNCTPADTSKPVLALPDPITAEATSAGGTAVNYTAPSATDNAPASPTVTCNSAPTAGLNSGSTFPIGTTTVSCSATDTAKNVATGSFTVTVADSTAPVLTNLPADVTAVEATSSAGAAVAFTAPTASDAVDGSRPVTCSTGVDTVVSGATFPLGTTTVTCSASDLGTRTSSDTFTVTVVDTQGPVIGEVTDLEAEAAGADGAVVTYTVPSAVDVVTGNETASCTPASGSTFELGATEVTCEATDGTTMTSKTFTITVVDTTAPVLAVTADITAEATGPAGAEVTYAPTASDAVEGATAVQCDPTSNSVFGLAAPTTVTCSTADSRGNSASDDFTVTVVDTTPPVLSGLADKVGVQATGPNGAPVAFAVTANDLVDLAVDVTCTTDAGTVVSGASFPVGSTTVTCSASDSRSNGVSDTFDVTVIDTIAPVVASIGNASAEATSAAGAVVTFTAPTATDAVGPGPVLCVTGAPGTPVVSGDTFPLGLTEVTCSSTDVAGNTGSSSFTVTVADTKAPVLTVPANQEIPATGPDGAVSTFTATAKDVVDGDMAANCVSGSGLTSGSTFPIGTTTLQCSATDSAGNTATGSFTISVQRRFTGFYQPIDTGRTVNLIKAGSTVPLKFEVFAGSTELTSVDIFKPLSAKQVTCGTSTVLDEVEQLVAGGTALRYDSTGGQFIWNWKTPAGAGRCYQVAVMTTDGAELTAQFKLR